MTLSIALSKLLRTGVGVVLVALTLVSSGDFAWAQNKPRLSDVANTPHNLSASGKGPWTSAGGFAGTFAPATMIRATSQTELCVFCHTPHGGASSTPLWNRTVGAVQYTTYFSSSIQSPDLPSNQLGTVSNTSRLCLACHDGSQAIGAVTNAPGSGLGTAITTSAGDNASKMPVGGGVTTGNTRNLGGSDNKALNNDHPISFTYNQSLRDADRELRAPAGTPLHIAEAETKTRPKVPTYGGTDPATEDGKVECASCHDPHIKQDSSETPQHNIKFLRLNRFQVGTAGADFSPTNDISCLACHNKAGWVNSAHALSGVADEAYTPTEADNRGFYSEIKVWEAACLNCHDTHTVTGARRLLRNGATGSASAIEETCYQCHQATPAVTPTAGVPNIKTEFARARRMPIVTAAQGGGTGSTEVHDITDADFVEASTTLGSVDVGMRHAECTDCHNPHRVMRNSKFYGVPGDANSGKRTHDTGGAEGNVASGVLKGAWGVEPIPDYSGNWPKPPSFAGAEKKGDPGASPTIAKSNSYMTREYQLCFKCHSNYGSKGLTKVVGGTTYGLPDNFGPALGTSGLTPSATNSLSYYTNVAAEFSSVNATDTPENSRDQGENGACSANCVANYTNIDPTGSAPGDVGGGGTMGDVAGAQNHRSWHPVMYPTGRSHAERRIGSTATGNFRAPFNGTTSPNGLGLQTMHCSDCHGADGSWTQGSGPTATAVQGPHGSDNNFLLRSTTDTTAPNNVWSTSSTIGSPVFCGNCHNPTAGTQTGTSNDGNGRTSGFNNAGTNGGGGHGNAHGGKPCMRCHIAVPHGWKNKAFLVNLNCRGEEAGVTTCDATSGFANYVNQAGTYSQGPYYNASFLRVQTWRASGNWSESSCGATGANRAPGKDWMTDGNLC